MTAKIDPPETRNITVNRLPGELVVAFKSLAVQLNAKIEDLMQLALEDAVRKGDGFALDITRLNLRRKQERKQRKAAEAELAALTKKVEEADAAAR